MKELKDPRLFPRIHIARKEFKKTLCGLRLTPDTLLAAIPGALPCYGCLRRQKAGYS